MKDNTEKFCAERASLEREVAIHKYIRALDAGDEEVIAAVLELAIHDSDLNHILCEIDTAFAEELNLIADLPKKRVMANILRRCQFDCVSPFEGSLFPLKEMVARGYFDSISGHDMRTAKIDLSNHAAEELLSVFMSATGFERTHTLPVLWKKTLTTRAVSTMDNHALAAWTMRVLRCAASQPPARPFNHRCLTKDFLIKVAQLSSKERGPVLAQEFLFEHGISLVIEPHLPRTHLDGAAIGLWAEHPVIGMTLRHDRIDNFWFCLLHEIAHLRLHFWNDEGSFVASEFYDDFDCEANDPREKQADVEAGEALIPEAEWCKDPVSVLPTPQAVTRLAKRLNIHPAIVAGRVRHRKGSYRVLTNMVGQGEVRSHFPDVAWKS